MNIITIVLTAIALSMDAFAVSVTKGMTLKNLTKGIAIRIALFFGVFQAVMPLMGWMLGITEKEEAANEASTTLEEEEKSKSELSNKELTTLAIATSIDALAIGVSFAFLNVNIVSSSLIIGLITFIVCFIGVIAGKKIGGVFKDYAELIGGIILILIGINIFNEHTGFIMNLIHSIF